MSDDPAAPRCKDPTPDLGGLENNIGLRLRLAQLAVFQDLITTLRPHGLRVTEFSVLVVIGKTPGLTQQAISAALQIQPPNLKTIIDGLRRQGLVRRSSVAADRRLRALSLTAQGQRLLAVANEAHAGHDRRLLACLGDADIAAVLEALKRIAAL
jgi:DNA-binding MarR family transcriptional regulator